MCDFSEDESDAAESHVPAVMRRPLLANHIAQERVTMETLDRQDHTFCGMVFDVQATTTHPIEFLEITSVAVRGELGPMTVWTTPQTYKRKTLDNSEWKLIYEQNHAASFQQLVPLELDQVVQLKPGESCGLFVHSKRPGDSAVVYDNQRGSQRCQKDPLLTILPGMAALDNRPFGDEGLWGEGWRSRREFVGRISIGVCWKLWNPECNHLFPKNFQSIARCLLLCASRPHSPLHSFSDAILFYILNMCRWDWFQNAVYEPEPPVPVHQIGRLDPNAWYSFSDDDF